jgi:protease-4
MKKRTAWVLAAGVVALALGAAAVGAIALVVRGGPGRSSLGWSGGAQYLELELEGTLAEEPAGGIAGLFESRPPSLRALVQAVDRAAGDPNVRGLLLRVGSLDAGWARAAELRDALKRFRKSGKPSWAHLEFAGNQEYFLATGCEKIAASPTAMLDVTGLAAEVTFYRGTLDKLGVLAQFEGVGKYKNAPNQYTEKGFTEPHREQMEALVGSLYDEYVRSISEARGIPPQDVRAILDEGPFDGPRAKEKGLVDEVLYVDQVEGRVPGSQGLSPGRYVRSGRGFGMDARPRMALVYAVGTIMPGESQSGPFGGGFVGSDTLARGIREAARDNSVRAIVLRVDSPGGSGTASDAVWRELSLARQKKPVVVSMGDYAASGGYYIAMNSDAIVAQPGTITGSIGVFSGKFSLAGLYEKLGISEEVVQRGRFANLFTLSRPWDEEERARVRQMNVAFYDTFVEKAAQGRHKTRDEIHAVAQGRVWTGVEAVHVGLVDELGGLDTAVALARKRARIPAGQQVSLVVMPERKGFFELLMERQEEDVVTRVLPPRASAMLEWMAALGEAGPIARLPYELEVR